jgi:hypothetical protein
MNSKTLGTMVSLLLTLSTWTASTLAAPPTKMDFGSKDMTDVEVTNIHHSGKLLLRRIKVADTTTVNGYLEAQESVFKQKTEVNGHIKAEDSQFNLLTVNGDADLKNVTVVGAATINGKLTSDHSNFDNTLTLTGAVSAKDSAFNKPIKANSTQLSFENCTVDSITIAASQGKTAQTVDLKGTKVANNIHFESGKGVVHQDSDSSVGGKVTGGTVQK